MSPPCATNSTLPIGCPASTPPSDGNRADGSWLMRAIIARLTTVAATSAPRNVRCKP